MDLHFNLDIATGYKSLTQQIRVLTEEWVGRNMYCPICGKPHLQKYENNHPVGDFFCNDCHADFELKSHKGIILNAVPDGAYDTMIQRITSLQNPNFFFLSYRDNVVQNVVLVPNHFFTPDIIIKRKPLSQNARRAGWVGCNIDISSVPELGRIFIIRDKQEIDHTEVMAKYAQIKGSVLGNMEARGWLFDVLRCVERIPTMEFTLNQVYAFAEELSAKHPDNNFIEAKIRQQLQLLRNRHLIEFMGRGSYRKTYL